VGRCELDAYDIGQRPVTSICEDGNETSGSIQIRKCLEQISEYQFLKKDSAPEWG